jgi:hypothetical protein
MFARCVAAARALACLEGKHSRHCQLEQRLRHKLLLLLLLLLLAAAAADAA